MRLQIPKVHGSTRKEKILRSLALMLVFGAVIWAFNENNKHVIATLNQSSSVYDETGRLDKQDKSTIVSFAKSLEKEFGMDLQVQVYGGDFVVPELDSKTIYVGIAPAIDMVELRFPPLMQKALGDTFITSLETTFLRPSFEQGDWPMAIQEVLVEILRRLEELNRGEAQ